VQVGQGDSFLSNIAVNHSAEYDVSETDGNVLIRRIGELNMNPRIKSIIYWAPRVLTIFLAAFLMVFSLDVFDGQKSFWQTALALLMHNLPSIVLLLVLILAWRKEWTGAVIYSIFGLVYLVTNLGRMHWSAFVLITGPLVLIGLLFLLAWYKARRTESLSLHKTA
jgi:hypothetical protein